MTTRDPSGRNTAHAAPLAAGLDEVAGVLRDLSQDADGRLLAVGERLGGIIAILDRLTRRFELLPRELEDDRLRDAADHFGTVSREVAAMAQALTDEHASLSRLAALNQQMGARIAQLRKTIRAISILAVNAQIEAAHIDTAREDLSAFAKEIVRLARAAEATAEGHAQEHEKVAELLRTAHETQAGFARTHEETLRSVGQQLEAALRALEARRVQAAGAAAEIGRRSKRISEEVGVVVMALQIGDITRQRLEHVSEALGMLSAGLEADDTRAHEPAAWSVSLTDGQKAAVAATVCRMQSAQTVQATTEFGGEIRRVIASLTQLAEEALTIVRFGSDMYGAADPHGGSFLEDLQASLKMTGALVRECQAARDSVDSAVASVAVSLGELVARLGSVRSLEVDMRLVGLNTALKCGRLGAEGRTLSVVAQELRGHANQTVQDADALMSALQEMTAAAGRFEQERQNRNASRIAAMEQEMATYLGPFEACGARLSQALAALGEQGGKVSSTLGETAAGITVHEAIAKALSAASGRLDAIAESIATDEADLEVARQRMPHFSNGRYTMARERDIHAQFVSGSSDAAVVPEGRPSPPPAEPSLDDVLF
jgi:hypothetical protein